MPGSVYDLNVTPSTLEVDYDKNLTELYQAITDQDWQKAIKICKTKPVQAATWVVRHYQQGDRNENDDNDNDVATKDSNHGNDGGGEQEIMWRFLPIHSACARQPPSTFIAALMNAYPDGARCVDDQGMYALHYACGNQASRDVIRQLLVVCPEAAKIPDPRGMLPIHYLACWGPSSVAIIDMMLVANRDVADARDADGNTPLDLALEGEYHNRKEVIALLQKWTGETNKRSNSRSYLHALRRDEEKKDADDDISTNADFDNRMEVRRGNKGNSMVLQMERDMLKLKMELMEAKEELDAKNRELKEKKQDVQWKPKCQKLEKKLDETTSQLESSKKELEQVKADFEKRSSSWTGLEKEVEELRSKVKENNSERDGLRKTLGDMMEKEEIYQKKSGNMNDRLATLSSTLESLLVQQAELERTVRQRCSGYESLYAQRTKKIKELMEMEENIQTSETNLEASLKKQTRELEAIAAVIKAAKD